MGGGESMEGVEEDKAEREVEKPNHERREEGERGSGDWWRILCWSW